MDTYNTVRLRLITLCDEKHFSLHKLALSSGIAPSTLKNILYGKSKNPGIVTIKLLCDGLGITLTEFFDTEQFRTLEQELK